MKKLDLFKFLNFILITSDFEPDLACYKFIL